MRSVGRQRERFCAAALLLLGVLGCALLTEEAKATSQRARRRIERAQLLARLLDSAEAPTPAQQAAILPLFAGRLRWQDDAAGGHLTFAAAAAGDRP